MEADNTHLESLGYTAEWFDLLTDSDRGRLLRGDIADPARHRASLFRRLSKVEGLDVARYLRLVAAEPDAAARREALTRLARRPQLDRWRLEVLKMSPLYQDPPLQAEISRQSILRGLRAEPVDDACLRDALESNDTDLHMTLLELSALPADILAALVEQGASKAVRRAAKARRTR